MVHDSVREELALKISPILKSSKVETPKVEMPKIEMKEKMQSPFLVSSVSAEQPVQPAIDRTITAEIRAKQTAPTLVEFHNKNTTIPEWRLQLQNSVRMRNERVNSDNLPVSARQIGSRRTNLATNGATALKVEIVEKIAPITSPNPIIASNPMLAKAMQRIEQSRQQFYSEEIQPAAKIAPAQPPAKNYPYTVHKPQEISSPDNNLEISSESVLNPKVASNWNEPKAKFDTNKLSFVANLDSVGDKPKVLITKVDLNIDDERDIHKTASPDIVAFNENKIVKDEILEINDEDGEIDDRAPISLRFNSAIFDLIIGSFASLLLLAPFMLFNGKFFSIEGFFAFLATCSIVMFIYMTTTIGLLGKTFGMKLFSLEIIDIEENDYPTLHQAAVSSAVYLLSLAFGGLGFITLLLNSEKRAAHDLLSGTIIVKEY
jgi:uncharacterized RDD family membrane protein YckC